VDDNISLKYRKFVMALKRKKPSGRTASKSGEMGKT